MSRTSEHNDRWILWILAALIVWLAVMGGGVFPGTPWVASAVAAAWWSVLALRRSDREPRRTAVAAYAGGVFLCFLVLTALPAPVHWTALHGPLRYGQNLEALARFEQAARLELIEAPIRRFALSRNVGGTLRLVVLTAGVLATGMLAARMDGSARRKYLRFLVFTGAGIAGAAVIGQTLAPQGHTLWWLVPVPVSQPGPMACFVNRNHYAGFMALLSVPAMVLLVADLGARRWRQGALVAVALGVMVPSLIVTQSRGGVLAWMSGILVVAGWMGFPVAPSATGRAGPRRFLPAVFMVAAGLGLLVVTLWMTPPRVRARLGEGVRQPVSALSAQTRIEAWRETLLVWRSYPLVGAGPNALRTVYPQHRLSSHREMRTHASNQYLQLLAETGVVGSLLAGFWVLAFLRAMMPARDGNGVIQPPLESVDPPRQRSQGDDRLFSGAALGAITVAAVHGMVDFPHPIPLYAFVLISLAALGLPFPARVASAGRRVAPVAVGSLIAVFLTLPAWRSMHRRDDPHALQHASMSELMQAVAWAPTYWPAWYEFGRRGFTAQSREAAHLGEDAITRAARLDPNNYLLWYELGRLRLNLNDRAGAAEAFERVRTLRSWVPIPDLEPENTTL